MESNHKLSHGKEVDPENLGYEYFSLQVNNQTPINVSRHQLIKILNGTNTSISLSGNDITFNNTATATPGASYTHPDKAWVDKTNLAGASVISNLRMNESSGYNFPTSTMPVNKFNGYNIYRANSNLNNVSYFIDGSLVFGDITHGVNLINGEIYLLAHNSSGSTLYYSDMGMSSFILGNDMSDKQAELNTILG